MKKPLRGLCSGRKVGKKDRVVITDGVPCVVWAKPVPIKLLTAKNITEKELRKILRERADAENGRQAALFELRALHKLIRDLLNEADAASGRTHHEK